MVKTKKKNVILGLLSAFAIISLASCDNISIPIIDGASNDNTLKKDDEISSDYNNSTGYNPGDFSPIVNIKKIDREGNEFDFDISMNKGKVTVVNFWAIWCGPCIEKLPQFNTLNNKYSAELLEVIAVHDGNSYDNKKVLKVMNGSSMKNYTFDWAYDDLNCSYYRALGGRDTYPITIIID